MIDCIDGVVFPSALSLSVYPNGIIVTVEQGEVVLCVTHSKVGARKIYEEKRAETRAERFVMAAELLEDSAMLEESGRPDVVVRGNTAKWMVDKITPFVPRAGEFHDMLFSDGSGVEALVFPKDPGFLSLEAVRGRLENGVAVIRQDGHPEATVFRSREQGRELVGQLRDLLDDRWSKFILEHLEDSFLPESVSDPVIVFGGFAASYLGVACLAREISDSRF